MSKNVRVYTAEELVALKKTDAEGIFDQKEFDVSEDSSSVAAKNDKRKAVEKALK